MRVLAENVEDGKILHENSKHAIRVVSYQVNDSKCGIDDKCTVTKKDLHLEN